MTSDALAPLLGARVRRIDVPGDDLAALTVSLESGGAHLTRVLVLSFSARVPGVGLLAERPAGAPANAFCQLLRKHLEGAVVVAAEAAGGGVLVRLRRGPDRSSLTLAPGSLTLEVGGRSHALRARELDVVPPVPRWFGATAGTIEELDAAGAALASARGRDAEDDETLALLRELRALGKRLDTRAAAVRRDLAREEEIPALRARGTLVLASLHAIPRGATEVTLVDHTLEPPREASIELDPSRDPREQARLWFERARKLERGTAISRARLAETVALAARAHALVVTLARSDASAADRDEARTLLDRHAAARTRRGAKKKDEPARLPYRRIEGHGGREIRVGRGARDNDALTTKHAAPHDLWLHARGARGAHVVVPLSRGETCPPELLLDAATLAAHFSDLARERVVEVDHVARGHVRKRKGMPPGMVEVGHPKTIAVRLEPGRLARLLKKQ